MVLRLLEMAVRDKGFIEEFPTVAVLTPYKGQLRRLQSSLTPFLDGQTRMPSEALFVSTGEGGVWMGRRGCIQRRSLVGL